MYVMKWIFAFGTALLLMILVFGNPSSVAQQPSSSPPVGASEASSAPASEEALPRTTAPPVGLDSVQVGPLEITPSKANLVLGKDRDNTTLNTTLRFKIKNTSASDVKIILFKNSIEATDALGTHLFADHRIRSGGVMMSEKRQGDFNKAFQDEKGKLVTLSPKQIFEVQLLPSDRIWVADKDNEFIKSHRPKTLTFSANIGILSLDNTTDIRGFSFSDLPLQISAP